MLRYLKRHGGWTASGTLQRLAAERAGRSPANAARRMRELHEEGKVEVKYVKGHAYYRANRPYQKVTYYTEDGTRIEKYELANK